MLNLPQAFLGVAQMAAAAFGAPFYVGRIIAPGTAIFDEGGSIITPAEPTDRACMVQIDTVDERNRPEGWGDRDYRFLLLSASFAGTVDSDASIEVTDATAPSDFRGVWSVSSLQRDPAAIGYVGRGRRT